MIEDIISLVIHEAKKRPGVDISEALFLVWEDLGEEIDHIESEIHKVQTSKTPDPEKRRVIENILNAHKT